MRILYFSRGYTVHDHRFLRAVADSDHEGWFLKLDPAALGPGAPPLPDRICIARWEPSPPTIRQPKDVLDAVDAFRRVVQEVQPDLVHAGPVLSCGLLAALADVHPFVLMSWGSDLLVDADRDGISRWMARFALSRADLFLCDNEAVKEKARRFVPIPDERIVEFPWGVDLDRFAIGGDPLGLHRRPGWGGAFILLSTRAWEPPYGTMTLLEGFRRAYERDRRMRLVLLGGGSLRPKVAAAAADPILGSALHVPGAVAHDDMPAYFRSADLYVSTALSDGTSVSLLEAMASGLPVVATDTPGNRQWIRPGRNGWLVRPEDPRDLAQALLEVARLSPEARRTMGRANRETVERNADWRVGARKLLDAYARLEAAKRSTRS